MRNEHDLEEDMKRSELILAKVQDDRYAQNLYAALCNMQWQKAEVWPVLKDELWSCTWRYAGGIVADLQSKGDYMSWYCSGIGGGNYLHSDYDDLMRKGYVPESTVTDEIKVDLATLGWRPVPYPEDDRHV